MLGIKALESVMGDGGASKSSKEATRLLQGLELPDIKRMELELQDLVSQGVLSPEQAQAQLQEQSLLNGIQVDPRLKNAQLDALSGLQERVDNEGLTAQDRANIERTKGELAGQQRGQRESILQDARQRGVGGSGLELLAQLQAQQGQAQEASQQGFDMAALQQNQKLAALEQLGQMGGQMRSQEFGEQSQVAAAQDAINQFNAQNRQQTGLMNTQAKNQAQQYNLGEKQRIADSNTNTRNQQQQYNKALIQQDFENRYKKAGGTASSLQNQAQTQAAKAAGDRQMVGGLIQAGAMAASDKNVKTDIEQFDPSAFLDEITGYKYKYKDPKKYGEGEQVGAMAQDIEKGAPQAVSKDESGTKVVDYNKLGGPMLAALSDIHDRLKKIEGT